MPNENKTEIIAILDRSGSMASLTDDTIGGYNTFIKEQKEEEGECDVTLTIFDTEYIIVYKGKPVKEVPELTKDVYFARGSTALLDAVGRTLQETGARLSAMPENERPGKVIVLIITDGMENASREYTADQVKKMVEVQEKEYSWKFLFFGANMDAVNQARGIGIRADDSIKYGSGSVGTSNLYGGVSKGVRRMRRQSNTEWSASKGGPSLSADEKKLIESS